MDATMFMIFLCLAATNGGSAQNHSVSDTSSEVTGSTPQSISPSTHEKSASHTSYYSPSIAPSSIAPSYFNSSSPSDSQHSSAPQSVSVGSSSPQSVTSTSLQSSTESVYPSINETSISSTASPSPISPSISSISPKSTTSPIVPTKSSKPHPSSSVSPQKVIVKCGEECKSLKKRLWAAGVFAVFFGVASLVFMFLLFRQCRISREVNDPALSRLI